jgi:hypothetical protein
MEVSRAHLKNTECTIYIATNRGRTWTYSRETDGWTQTGPNGKVHRLTAEQLLSHILPPLAGVSPAKVRVEPDVRKKPRGRPRQGK